MKQKRFGCFSIVVMFLSVAFTVGAAYLTEKNLDDWEHAKHTTGVVIENVSSLDDEGAEIFKPTILYFNDQHDSVTFTTTFASSFIVFDVGDTLDVLYLHDKAISNTFPDRWGGITLLWIFACTGLALSAFIIRISGKKQVELNENSSSRKSE